MRPQPRSNTRKRTRVVAAVLAIAAFTAAGLAAAPAGGLPPSPPSASKTKVVLKRLTVAPPAPRSGYSRAKFGRGWATTSNGCDVRERVLIRDGRGVQTGAGCRILGGHWRSVYDGKVFDAAHGLDIDHIVPLANAWRSGARSWTPEQRREFANDLRDPQLLAVSASSNRSKGDRGPEQWQPKRKAVWCLYARWWIDVKRTWKLSVAASEKQALASMLGSCH
jgi:Protein of unknown function (DUF1524)